MNGTVGKIVRPVVLVILVLAVGLGFFIQARDRKTVQDSVSTMNDKVRALQDDVLKTNEQWSALQTKFSVLERTATTLCYVRLDMVWDDAIRRDPYYFAKDNCGPDGFRCLTVGGDVSPSCYSREQCSTACTGRCVSISELKELCQ